MDPVAGRPGPDIWVHDVATGHRSRVQTGPAPSGPVWSPDGTDIAYYAYRQGRGALYRKRADGSGNEELLVRLPPGVSDAHVTDWSPDGRFLVFDTSAVVRVLSLESRRAVDVLREDVQVFGARFSPDSRFLAYVSDESGRNEIYVCAFDASPPGFPLNAQPVRISGAGGEGMVHWRGDGRELQRSCRAPRFPSGDTRMHAKGPRHPCGE